MTNRRLVVIFGVMVSVIFLFLAFRGLQPDAFFSHLAQVNGLSLVAGAAIYFVAVLLIAWRWRFLVMSVSSVPMSALMSLVCIGYMGNNVYPLRAGEALRVFLLRRDHGIAVTSAATTVIVERVFDGIVMLSFILIGLLAIDIQSEAVRTVLSFAAPIFGISVIVFLILAMIPDLTRSLVSLVTGFLLPRSLAEKIRALSEDFLKGLAGLRSPLQLLGVVVFSYLTWGVEAFVYWVVMGAFGFELGYAVALLVVGTVNLAGLLPASPGQIGVYEFFVSTVMIAVGIADSQALAYAIVVHVVIWLPVTLVGFGLLIWRGMGWSEIRRAQELEAKAAAS